MSVRDSIEVSEKSAPFRLKRAWYFLRRRLGIIERCPNCDHDATAHNPDGCNIRIQVSTFPEAIRRERCPCPWNGDKVLFERKVARLGL